MPAIDAELLSVYRLLVDGRATDNGLSAAEIERQLKLDAGNLSRLIRKMVGQGYVVQISGTKRPKLYCRGPNSHELDFVKLTANLSSDAESVKVVSPLQLSESSFCSAQTKPVACVHLHELVTFDVQQVGTLNVTLPGGQPCAFRRYKAHNNSASYSAKVTIEGREWGINVHEGKQSGSLQISGPRINATVDGFEAAGRYLIGVASWIAQGLSAAENWQMSTTPRNQPRIAYATKDRRIVNLAKQRRLAADIYIDESEGVEEAEADGPHGAVSIAAAMNIDERQDIMEASIRSMASDIAAMKQHNGGIIEVCQGLQTAVTAQQQNITTIATNVQMLTQAMAQLVNQSSMVTQKIAADTQEKAGGMYA